MSFSPSPTVSSPLRFSGAGLGGDDFDDGDDGLAEVVVEAGELFGDAGALGALGAILAVVLMLVMVSSSWLWWGAAQRSSGRWMTRPSTRRTDPVSRSSSMTARMVCRAMPASRSQRMVAARWSWAVG
jgi:hypothetical protein